MRTILTLLVAAFLSTSIFGAATPGGYPASMNSRVTGSTNLANAFTDANAALLSDLKGVSNFAVYNGTATAIIIGTAGGGGLTCGASTRDGFVVPANSGIVIERVYINKVICGRSSSGTISSGTIYTSAW